MLKIILKMSFAIILVTWLISKGTLNVALALQLKTHPLLVVMTLILLIIPFATTAFRWKWLLEIKVGRTLKPLPMVGLTWMGQFFSTILPGGVTGDLVKIVYAQKLDKKLSKGFLLISAFVDRIFGLIGLLIIQGVVCLALYPELVALSPKVKMLLYFNFSLFLGVVLFIMTLFLRSSWQNFFLQQIARIPVAGEKLSHALEHFWLIGKHKRIFFQGLAITIVTHIIVILAFYWLISPFLDHPLPLQYAFAFIPLGLISVMVPISPMGLGVGHAMFQELFSYFSIMNGASLFNLFFLFEIFINLLGGIPYIFYRDQSSLVKR